LSLDQLERAGKTTTLRAIAGVISPNAGAVRSWTADHGGTPSHQPQRAGYITEELNLSIHDRLDNLLWGLRAEWAPVRASLEQVFDLFRF
jgi:ABC-type branched-subunit amino acid transport system ATPase component